MEMIQYYFTLIILFLGLKKHKNLSYKTKCTKCLYNQDQDDQF